MTDARELLEQTLRVNHPSIARRLGDALRAVLYYADVLEKHGDLTQNISYFEAATGIRRRIAKELTGDPNV